MSAETTALAYSSRRHPERAVGGQAKDLAGWDISPSEALQEVEVQQFRGRFIRSRRRTAKDLADGRDATRRSIAAFVHDPRRIFARDVTVLLPSDPIRDETMAFVNFPRTITGGDAAPEERHALRPAARVAASLILCVVLTGCSEAPSAAPALDEQVTGRVEELRQTMESIDEAALTPRFAEAVRGHEAALNRTDAIRDPLYRLYKLREPAVGIHSLRFLAENEGVTDIETFDRVWEASTRSRTPVEVEGGPAVARALVDASRRKADILQAASRAYARISSPQSGLYYLSEAEGHYQFADAVASIAWGAEDFEETRIDLTSLEQGLDETEKDTIAIFERDPEKRTAIPISARLKESRELLDSGHLEGAALRLLETRMMIAGHAEETPEQSRGGLVANDSIESILVAVADETPERRAIVEVDLLPFYRSLLEPAASAEARVEPDVTVTFVRWPYT